MKEITKLVSASLIGTLRVAEVKSSFHPFLLKMLSAC